MVIWRLSQSSTLLLNFPKNISGIKKDFFSLGLRLNTQITSETFLEENIQVKGLFLIVKRFAVY